MKKLSLLIASFLFLMGFVSCVSESSTPFVAPTKTRVAMADGIVGTQTPVPTRTPGREKPSPLPSSLDKMVLAYANDNEIWKWEHEEVMNLANTEYNELIISSLRKIALSDDGNKVAYFDNEYEVWVVDKDGSNKTLLIASNIFRENAESNEEIIVPYHIQWIPKSHTILVLTLSWIDTGFYFPINDMYLVDADIGELDIIKRKENGIYFYPSMDGRRIAYVSDDHIGIMNSDGSDSIELLGYPSVPVGFHPFYIQIVWSQDNQSFVVVVPPPMDDGSDYAKVWKIHLDSSTELLTEFPWTENQYYYPLSTISPDFSFVLYSIDHPENDKENELHLISLSSNQDKSIWQGKVNGVHWSPSSEQFLILLEKETNNVLVGDIEGNLTPVNIGLSAVVEASWIDEDNILLISDDAIQVATISEQSLVRLVDIENWYLTDQYDFAK